MTTSDDSGTPTSSVPGAQPIMVPVKRYDVTLTMDDVLTPLTQTAANLQTAHAEANAGAPMDSELADHLQHFNDLVGQLQDVVAHINQIDSNLLASKPGPPPSASPPAAG